MPVLPDPGPPSGERPRIASEPAPEPASFEDDQERLRRRWRRVGWPLLILLLAGAGWGARPAVHLVKAWQARRLAAESLALADRGQLIAAADKARDAFQIYSGEPEAWRALGRMLTRAGQGRLALPWWQKAARAGHLTVADRRDWVTAALAADAPEQARTQLEWLLARQEPPDPADLLLAGSEAVWHRDALRAVGLDERVLADRRANARERFNAAVQILYLAAPGSPESRAATAQVAQAARAPADPLALDALTLLGWRTIEAAGPPAGLTCAELAAALEAQPRAGDSHRVLALELRALAEPAREDALMSEAAAHFRTGDDAAAAALLGWLFRRGHHAEVLRAVTPARAAGSRELVKPYLDSLAALGRYEEARALLGQPRLALDPYAARMYLAVVRAHLGEAVGAAGEWARALDAAGKNADQLFVLGQFAEGHGQPATAEAAFAAALAAAPERRAVHAANYQRLLASGKTAPALAAAAEIVRRWPGDAAARDEATYLRLLLGTSPAEARGIEEALMSRPPPSGPDWQAKTSLLVARLRQGRPAAAGAVFAGHEIGDEPGGPLGPDAPARARAAHAAALRAQGRGEQADAEARLLAAAPLLPEERALVAGRAADLPQG